MSITGPAHGTTRTQVAIIGGGIMGAASAYHLARAGITDVVLLEADELASGSSGKPLGGVRAQFSDVTNIELGLRSLEFFRRFSHEVGVDIGLRTVGYLFALRNDEDIARHRVCVTLQNSLGVPSRIVDPAEAVRLCPYLDPQTVLAGVWSPSDGFARAGDAVRGLAGAAQARGVQVRTGSAVTGIDVAPGGVARIHLADGADVLTPTVVCAAGAWSSQVGEMVGVNLPVTPKRREIAFTPALSPRPPQVPFTIDYSTTAYFHGSQGGGLLLGWADPDQPDGFGREVSRGWHDHLRAALRTFAPELAGVHQPRVGGVVRAHSRLQCAHRPERGAGFSVPVRHRVLRARFPTGAGRRRVRPGSLPGAATGGGHRTLRCPPLPAPGRTHRTRHHLSPRRTGRLRDPSAPPAALPHASTPEGPLVTTTTPAALAQSTDQLRRRALDALHTCGVDTTTLPGTGHVDVRTPVTGGIVATLAAVGPGEVEAAIEQAHQAFLTWRSVPAPVRGQLVKRLGELLSEHKEHLADLIGIEVGKIASEALGEIQEMIDICDYAVGLSRQLEGRTMPSERPGHRLMETWHPLGVVAVISAFNFPAAVWAWNTAVALVCGDTVVWKPSEKTPLVALASAALLQRAARELRAPEHLNTVVVTDATGAAPLVDSPLVPLVSATGSERLGAQIAPRIAARFGRAILELGGNNAAVVTPSADLDLAVRGIVFAAAGTAGQRCTTLRRLIVHESVADEVVTRVAAAYRGLNVGDPFDAGTLVGPLFNGGAHQAVQDALAEAVAAGGTVVAGGDRVDVGQDDAYYVRPALVTMPVQADVVQRETFGPVLYVLTYRELDEAIALHNGVPQGLSSAIFTQDQREAEVFLSAEGSDCGIVNVNIGTSGAEIGGAFGGEKTTGGGRESGSDAWRAYMRRATNTVNYSRELPLAQGVSFA